MIVPNTFTSCQFRWNLLKLSLLGSKYVKLTLVKNEMEILFSGQRADGEWTWLQTSAKAWTVLRLATRSCTLHPSPLYSCFILCPLFKLASFTGANMFLSKGFWPCIFPPCALNTQLLANSELQLISPSSPTISIFLEMMLWVAECGSRARPCSHQAAELGTGCLLQYSHYVILLMVPTLRWTSLCLGLASEEWARSLKQFPSHSLSLHHISLSSYFFGGAQPVLAKWKNTGTEWRQVPVPGYLTLYFNPLSLSFQNLLITMIIYDDCETANCH